MTKERRIQISDFKLSGAEIQVSQEAATTANKWIGHTALFIFAKLTIKKSVGLYAFIII